MKTIILSLLLIVLCSVSTYSSNIPIGISIGIEITFGHDYPDCIEKGLCHIKITGEITKTNTDESIMTYIAETNTLIISASKNSIVKNQPEKLADFEGKNYYTIPQQWVATKDINTIFKATNPIVVKPGTYPMVFKDGAYIITIKLK